MATQYAQSSRSDTQNSKTNIYTCTYMYKAQLVFILSHQGNVDALTTLSAAVPQSVSYTRHLSVYRGSALSSSLPSNATGET